MRIGRVIAVAGTALVLALAGCGGPPAQSGAAGAETIDALALTGNWRVTDAEGEQPGAIVQFNNTGVGRVFLWRDCGVLDGSYRATDSGMFLGEISGGSGRCFPMDGPANPAWLRDATSFEPDGAGWRLLAADGSVMARLLAGGTPTPDKNSAYSVDAPVRTDDMREFVTPPAPLPVAMTPASTTTIQGRWVPRPAKEQPRPAFALFLPDGSWQGSDGCNGLGGRWALDDDGWLLTIAGLQTQIGCDTTPIAEYLMANGRVAIDGDELVFFDYGGAELGRLTRDRTPLGPGKY